MRKPITKILSEDQFPRVFPLVELHNRGLSLEQWLDYATKHCRGAKTSERGFLVLEDAGAVVKGLVEFEIDSELADGPVLRATNLLALGVLPGDGRRTAERLVQALEDLGRTRQCRALYLSQPLTEGLKWRPSEGFDPTGLGLHLSHWTTRKTLTAPDQQEQIRRC